MIFRFVIGWIFVICITTLSAQAEQRNHSGYELDRASTAVQALVLSRTLATYGRRNHDALALILAADMRKKVALKHAQRAQENRNDKELKSGQIRPSDVSSILVDAEKFAAGNETYLELIKDIRFSTSKGKSDGPAFTIATIKTGGVNHHNDYQFEGKKYAEIYVEGSDEANLDIFVHDEKGKLMCSDTDMSNINYCGWTPDFSGLFKITIVNRGNIASQYFLISN